MHRLQRPLEAHLVPVGGEGVGLLYQELLFCQVQNDYLRVRAAAVQTHRIH